jgi:hypothetical protein
LNSKKRPSSLGVTLVDGVGAIELRDLGNGSCEVTESFDGSHAPWIAQLWLNFRKAYPWTQLVVAKSLVRLKEVAEND